MNTTSEKSTVLVITENLELLSSLLESNTSDFNFISRESVQTVLDESQILNSNHIIILDIDSIEGGSNVAIDQALKLKKVDPTQVLMLVGEAEPLSEILKSNIQPLIYRAFNKPISPNQIFLSFTSASKVHSNLIEKQAAGEDILSVGPIENQTNIDSIANERNNKPIIFAAIGILALGIIGWLVFGNSKNPTQAPVVLTTQSIVDDSLIATNEQVDRVNQLNQEAATAILEGRSIEPEGDNALYYYNEVLSIDPYDFTAHEGKKAVASELKTTYETYIANAEFDKALAAINAIQEIDPLDSTNTQLRENLETSIAAHVQKVQQSGTQEEIEQTASVLSRIGSELQSTQTAAAAALQQEKTLLADIDKALDENNLIPPQNGNAYAIVSEALQKNTISKVNFAPRISSLSSKLVGSANTALTEGNLEDAAKLTALVNRLDVDPSSVATLTTKIEEKKAELQAIADAEKANAEEAAQTAAQEETVEVEPEVAKIIPAKIISREAPKYPSRALSRNIEGWVSLGFTIDAQGLPKDIKVVDSEPSGTFDDAAIASVKKWRFSPARNEQTQQAVESFVEATKLNFRLN